MESEKGGLETHSEVHREPYPEAEMNFRQPVAPAYFFEHRRTAGGEERFKQEVFDLFVEFFCKQKPMVLKRFIDNIERSIIVKVLMRARGNQKVAAKVLGIKYTTLNEKIKKYGIRFQKQPVMSNF